MQVGTIGMELAKSLFQVHGIDGALANKVASIAWAVLNQQRATERVAAA